MPWRSELQHPERLIAISFAAAILIGTAFLLLPWSTASGDDAPFITALFTTTSAICVTGLTVVDTGTYWSGFGQFVIMLEFQIGGLGVMTLTALTIVLFGRRIGLRQRVLTQAGAAASSLGTARRLAVAIGAFTFLFESITATVLTLRFWQGYDMSFPRALWFGVFHAISAFNNAGFGLLPDNLVRFVQDPTVSLAIAAAIISGGLGFPVWLELRDRGLRGVTRLSLHARLTLSTTAVLLVLGFVAVLVLEWSNPATLGQWPFAEKLLPSFFQSVTPRTAGFNTLDYSQMREETWLTQMMLMFVGAGPASTGGGIKVTSAAVLLLFVVAEARGHPDTIAFGRRLPAEAIRQSFVIAFLALNAIVVGTLAIMVETDFGFARILFEAISAFGTVGLSTGITFDLPDVSRIVLVLLMYLGRVGPYTLALAFALRQHRVKYRYAEERPIIG